MATRQQALIVEDRSDWQAILSKTLTSIGWTVSLASNYDQALELLNNTLFDLAVIDPVLDNSNKFNRDGLRVLVEIHSHYPETILIVVSGSVSQEALRSHPNLPDSLPLVEKQHWQRDQFIKLVREKTNSPDAPLGKTTVVRMLKEAQKFALPSKEMPTPPRESDRRGAPRLLIVEDRQDWQVILARILDDEGWFWRYVPSAEMALDLLQSKQEVFHVVLLDLRLGEADVPLQEGPGWNLLDYLATASRRTRVIIISGEASRGDVAALFTRYPIDGFLDKDSFKKNELLELIYSSIAKPTIRIQTLGNFQVWRDDKLISDFGSSEAEKLFKILVAQRGQWASKSQLIRWVFPFANTSMLTQHQPHPALDVVINTIRFLLEPELDSGSSSAYILEQNDAYALDMSQPLSVDIVNLEDYLVKGKALQNEQQDEAAIQLYEEGRTLYQGDFLPGDRQGQWSFAARAQVEKTYARLLNRLADLYAKQGQLQQAIDITQRCLQIDSYHESTHRRMMRYQYCAGNLKAAQTVYHTLEKLKREFFQEEPSAETQALIAAINAGQPIECVEQQE
jgi:two-component SAPR family response regulator